MGRKPVKKLRINDQVTTDQWVKNIIPIILRNGFYKMTMDEVVKLAGVSKATFYKYFSSREELIDNIIQQKVTELYGFQSALFDTRLPYIDRYLEATLTISRVIGGISNTFLSDLKRAYPEKFRIIDEFKAYSLRMLENYYSEGITQGFLSDINPKVVIMTDHLFFTQLMDGEFLEKKNISLKDAFMQYTLMKNNGLIKRKDEEDGFIKKLYAKIHDVNENLEEINA